MIMVEKQKNGRCPCIGIIGGTRGMGKWFSRFFEKEGYAVHVSGSQTGLSVREMAERCQVVVVSVPIGVTTTVIESLGPHMQKDALLMDLTSLKQEPVRTMLASSVSEVIGCHPLFGPRTESIAGQNVVLCPARGERWISWLRDVLIKHGALVVETTPENHDGMMAIVQGLNHFNTIAMGVALGRSGFTLSELKPFLTPAFNAKLKIIEKVFCQNPGLYADILTMNPQISPFIEKYATIVADLADFIHQKNADGMTNLMQLCRKNLDFDGNPRP
jgi:prephenate dehydrogenase